MTPGVLDPRTATGQLSIMGESGILSMHTAAWNLPSVLPLWLPGTLRGSDTILPLAPGVLFNPRRRTVTEFTLPLAVAGEVNANGAPYADPWIGLQTNLAFLSNQLLAVSGSGGETEARNATLTMPSGVDRSARVHVQRIEPTQSLEGVNTLSGAHGVVVICAFSFLVLDGAFT